MIALDKGFVTGSVTVSGALGPLTFNPSPTQLLRVVAIELQNGEAWNEALGTNGIKSGISEMNTLFGGQGTIAQHATTMLSMFGNVPENVVSAVVTAASGADKLIGQKVTVEDAIGVAIPALIAGGVKIPSGLAALFPTIENAVAALIAKLKG